MEFDKTFKSSLKSFDIKLNEEVISKLSETLNSYTSNILEKINKNNKSKLVVDNKLLLSMKGGRVLLPSEYFGETTNHYVSNPSNEINLDVTDEVIRPAIDIKTPDYEPVIKVQEGGLKKKIKLSEKLVKLTIEKINKDKNFNLKLKNETIKTLKNKYEELITSLINDVKKGKNIDTVLKKKKFSLLT